MEKHLFPAAGKARRAQGRAGWPLALAFAAALVCLGCGDPLRKPEATIGILEAHEAPSAAGEGYEAVVTYRITVSGGLSVERSGISVRVESSARSYWASEVIVESIPPWASVTCVLRLPFSDAAERYVDGSAVVEASWFE